MVNDFPPRSINKLKSLQNLLNLSVVTLIITVWSTVSFLAYQNKSLKKYAKKMDKSTSLVKITPPFDSSGCISNNDVPLDWKTEVNAEYGFTILFPPNFVFVKQPWTKDYPQEFTIYENKYLNQDTHYPRITINIISTDMVPDKYVAASGTTKSMFDEIQNLRYYDVSYGKNISINGHEAYQFDATRGNEGGPITIIKKDNDYLIEIANRITGMGEISNDLYFQILSTLRFDSEL